MKPATVTLKKQSGVALLVILFTLIFAGGYAFYRNANIGFGANQQDAKLTLTLARAKDALIAYAVVDKNRPGRMLCPDIIGDGVSPTLSLDDCNGWASGKPDVYSGWLPWKTLDLVEPSDDRGTKFQYAASRFFGGDRKTPPLNSDTPTSLRVDVPSGSPSNDVVAVIISTRGPLDTRNADGDEYFYSGSSKAPEDNDVLAIITRQELMAAVEKRVAGEVKACLEEHAVATGTYPWPSPLSASLFSGKTKSLFGRIPATQPGGNIDASLKQSINDLTASRSSIPTNLRSASEASQALEIAKVLQQQASYVRASADRLGLLLREAYFAGRGLSGATAKQEEDCPDPDLSGQQSDSIAKIRRLLQALAASGLDIFLTELADENTLLAKAIDQATTAPSADTIGALQTKANSIFENELFFATVSPNRYIEEKRVTASTLATETEILAVVAKADPTGPGKLDAVLGKAQSLYAANDALRQIILASRVAISPEDVDAFGTTLDTELRQYQVKLSTENLQNIQQAAASTLRFLTNTTTNSTLVKLAQEASVAALKKMPDPSSTPNSAATVDAANAAIPSLSVLATAIRNNGDNLAIEALTNDLATLQSGQANPPTTKTGRDALDRILKDAKYWGGVAEDQAKKAASKAAITVCSGNRTGGSVYSSANSLINQLYGEKTGTLTLLEKAAKSPTAGNLTKANESLAETRSDLSNLISSTQTLESILETSRPDAGTLTDWQGTACTFLKPSTGGTAWWHDNQWKDYSFFQISDRVRLASGKLQVNGTGTYRVVTLSASRAIGTQPQTPLLRKKVGDFLEGINAAPPVPPAKSSRDDDAQNPVTTFSNAPVSPTFNDRLAY